MHDKGFLAIILLVIISSYKFYAINTRIYICLFLKVQNITFSYIPLCLQAPLYIAGKDPPYAWPQYGELSFIDYSTAYRPGLPMVIKNINCSIKAGEKVMLASIELVK